MPRTKQAANPLILVDIDKLEASRASATNPAENIGKCENGVKYIDFMTSHMYFSTFTSFFVDCALVFVPAKNAPQFVHYDISSQGRGSFFPCVLGTLSSTAKLS